MLRICWTEDILQLSVLANGNVFHVKQSDFDVIVVGGGHAGAERRMRLHAWARAQLGYSLPARVIGVYAPAILLLAGLGKGHLCARLNAMGWRLWGRGGKTSLGIQFQGY